MKIDLELKKMYKIMIYPYIHETQILPEPQENRYREYHSNNLWEYDDFTHAEYLEILEFLREIDGRKTKEEVDKVNKEVLEGIKKHEGKT